MVVHNIRHTRNPLHIAFAYGQLLNSLREVSGQEVPNTPENCEAIALGIARRGVCLLAEDGDGELIGATFAMFDDPAVKFNFKRALGAGTWVRPDHRRKGVATALHEYLCAGLRKLGCERLVGAVHLANEASLKVALSQGFAPSATVVTKIL
jgi:L-amino acid N-acyltransferase YncA